MELEDSVEDGWASSDYIFHIDSSLWEADEGEEDAFADAEEEEGVAEEDAENGGNLESVNTARDLAAAAAASRASLSRKKSSASSRYNSLTRNLKRCWSAAVDNDERLLSIEEVKVYLEWFVSSCGNTMQLGRYKPGSTPELYAIGSAAADSERFDAVSFLDRQVSEDGSSTSSSASMGLPFRVGDTLRNTRIAAAAAAVNASMGSGGGAGGGRIGMRTGDDPAAPLTPDEFILRELADIRRLLLQRFLIEGGVRGDNVLDPVLDLDAENELFDILGALTEDGGVSGEPSPHFPVGEWVWVECEVCLDHRWLYRRPCCGFPVCHDCLKRYFGTKVSDGVVKIECCNPRCKTFVHRDEISARLDGPMKQKFYQFLVQANADPFVKTCPRCSHVTNFPRHGNGKAKMKNTKKYPERSRIVCSECNLTWCYNCHAPWHPGFSCRQYLKGDRLLKSWAHEMHHGQLNAQKCPKCQVYIQRTTGCDHMHCTRCKTDFCYRCGDRLRKLRFFGDHYSKLSIFGCKYRYKADKPVQRKLIRGAVFGGKLMVAPLLGTLGACAGVIALGFGIFILPVYGGVRLFQKFGTKRQQFHRFHISQPHLFRFGSDVPVVVHMDAHHVVPMDVNQQQQQQSGRYIEVVLQ